MASTPLALDTTGLPEANLYMLRRVDADAAEILSMSNFCAVYENTGAEWVRALPPPLSH